MFNLQDTELEALDKTLSFQVYLSGDGFVCGEQDEQTFAKIQNQVIDKSIYPNLFRWS